MTPTSEELRDTAPAPTPPSPVRRKVLLVPLRAADSLLQSLKKKPQYPSRETHRDYLVLLLLTGLRRTEALRLRWENV